MNMILIVDDEELLLEMYQEIVEENSNFRVFKATNGKEALEILTENSIDKVITDFKMPFMNGADLIKNICDLNLKVASILLCSGSRPEDFGLNHLEKTCSTHNIEFLFAPKPNVQENIIEFLNKKSA